MENFVSELLKKYASTALTFEEVRICDLLGKSKTLDEWNSTITLIVNVKLRAYIEQSGVIKKVLP